MIHGQAELLLRISVDIKKNESGFNFPILIARAVARFECHSPFPHFLLLSVVFHFPKLSRKLDSFAKKSWEEEKNTNGLKN